MVYKSGIFLVLIMICAHACVPPAIAGSEKPLPCRFYGSVTLHGSPAPPGTVIMATINGNPRGSITTTQRGKYASDCMFGPKLVVQAERDDFADDDLVLIRFFVNGQPADESVLYQPGALRWLDLSVTRTPEPTPTPTAHPPPTPLPTQTHPPDPPPLPVAAFNCSPGIGSAPLVVSFLDLSGPTITSWSWDFGDGNSTDVANPAHLYRYAGNYTVNLTVESETGSSSLSVPDCVIVLPPVIVPFPGQDTRPTDPDNDGFFDDINGNQRTDFDDVVLYFLNLDRIEGNMTPNPFDYNQNGRIDFDDLSLLFLKV